MNKTYITQQTHEHSSINYEKIRKDPEKYGTTEEAVKLMTVPGQSQTVSELKHFSQDGKNNHETTTGS